jgi:hypothetical protein
MHKSFGGNFIIAMAALVAVGGLFAAQPASAKGGRPYEVQNYQFSQPMHGYEGQAAGGYFCSYVRIPNRQCTWNGATEVCKVKGWILRQECR